MLKTILVFLVGILCGFWFSWLEPGSLIDRWRNGSKHGKNGSVETRDKGSYERLDDQVKVLCMVLTRPETHYRILHIKATWGRRCDVLLFFSTVDNVSIPIISLPVAVGDNYEWERTKESLMYVYSKHYLDRVDWVLRVDDETYVVVENLKYLLSNYSSYEALYFGRYMKPNTTSPELKTTTYGYMDGKAGYVLSKEAVRRAVVEGFNGNRTCKDDGLIEDDLQMGKCMELLKVKAGNSKDKFGRGRFFPMKPSDHIRQQLKNNSWKLTNGFFTNVEELDCCSNRAITFHPISSSYMHALEYLLYNLYP